MALITDPDLLNQATEVIIDTAAEDIQLLVAGNLSNDGVTLKAVYSFLKEEWRSDAALIKFDFPMTPITDEQMQIGVSSRNNGWVWEGDTTRQLIRTGGWQEVDGAGLVNREYAGIISLGSLEGGTQPYYQISGGAATDFTFAGAVNEAVQVFGDASNGNFDTRTFFNVYAREQGDTYGFSDLSGIGVTTMTFQVYRFPLSTGADSKIVTADIGIDATADGVADVAPYTNMSITYIDHANQGAYTNSTVYAANDVVQDVGDSFGNGDGDHWYITPTGGTSNGADANADVGVTDWTLFTGEREIGTDTWFAFGVVIDGNQGTAEQIYEFVQWSLRQTVDIDAGSGTQTGNLAEELLVFVGDTLVTQQQSDGDGTMIDDYQTVDINRLTMTDDLGVARTFPFTASLTINFSPTLQGDANAIYWVFFTNDDSGDNTGQDFNTANALLVDDDIAVDMTGNVSAATSVTHTFAYDTNVQRGAASAGTDAPITVVAIGLAGAQYVLAEGTIARSTTNSVTLTSPTERNYANP